MYDKNCGFQRPYMFWFSLLYVITVQSTSGAVTIYPVSGVNSNSWNDIFKLKFWPLKLVISKSFHILYKGKASKLVKIPEWVVWYKMGLLHNWKCQKCYIWPRSPLRPQQAVSPDAAAEANTMLSIVCASQMPVFVLRLVVLVHIIEAALSSLTFSTCCYFVTVYCTQSPQALMYR